MEKIYRSIDILKDHQDLKFILSKANLLATIQKELNTILDRQLINYCQVANINQKKLTILVDNASVATVLRYQRVELLNAFKNIEVLQTINDLIIRVRPAPTKKIPPKPAIKQLSEHSAQILQENAQRIENPQLKAALLRIAKHVRK